ncbi:hypothetical protein FF38_02754 [Lucilia cuprina]|uniref:Uncharacterized protein n=1 Tax=Lucilia cuprina TaxID=7375 RepID=A0A0L0CSW6_LUCCU|nr:hypothetical protein FF38_02754 [Lucilia cuprina]
MKIILKNTCKEVEIYKDADYNEKRDQMEEKFDTNRMLLQEDDFWKFLDSNANNIQILTLETETPSEEFMMDVISCETFYCNFHNKVLTKLKHLRKLKVLSTNMFQFNNEFFNTLNSSCANLESLSLHYCNVKEFTPVATLKELELKYCNGFTWNNFQTILGEMSLKAITSYATRYKGKVEYFEIVSSLEHISLQYNIVNNIRIIFQKNQEKLKNLKTLDWSLDHTKHLWINATNCPNLETLTVKPRNVLFENLQGFMYLKTLNLNVYNDLFDSDIVHVIKHSTIKYFTVNMVNYNCLIDMYEYNGSYNTEWANLKTNLLHIQLNYHKTLSPILHNWYILLDNNHNLTLKLKFGNLIEKSSLEEILGNQSFPKRLKSINICGEVIDCTELKSNYSTVIEKATTILQNNQLDENDQYISL